MATLTRPAPRAVVTLGQLARWPALIAFLVTLAASVLLVAAVAATYAALNATNILPGVTVGGVAIGGMDRAGAEARLRHDLPALNAGGLTITIDGADHYVPYSDVGRDYAMAAMLDRAFAVGRGGGPLEQAGNQFRTLTGGVEVAREATWNEESLMAALNGLVAASTVAPADAAISRSQGGYVATPAIEGHSLDLVALRSEVVAAMRDPIAGDAKVTLASTTLSPRISTRAAESAVAAFSAAAGTPLTLSGGTFSASLSPAQLSSWLTLAPTTDAATGWTLSVDREAMVAYLSVVAAQVNRPAVDAKLDLGENGVVAIAGATGQQLDVSASVDRVMQALVARASGAKVPTAQLAISFTEPSFSTAAATDLAARVEMVSSWTTRFIPGESNFDGQNIRIPAKLLNGTVVQPGERFSFLDTVGEISPARGFGLGGAIIRGHTQEQGAMGGGICSASTTLFNAALRAGYDIVDRTQHAYYINRYPVGLDATVFRSAGGGHDMAFVNDSQYPLWIRSFAGRAKVTFQIWTIPDGRTVKIGKPRIENRHEAEDTVVYVDTLKPGVEERVEYPVDGFDAWVTRTVYDASGAVLHNETWFSHYITVTGVTQVGISPTEPPPSEPPPPTP